jgi:hypothetical protein
MLYRVHLACARFELTTLVVIGTIQGRIQDFKLGGAHLKKLRRAEGGAKIFGIFRVKNHDFTPKNHIFPILGGAREIFGVFHVKNHDFTPKKIIFLPILGGGRAPGAPPPESAPAICIGI